MSKWTGLHNPERHGQEGQGRARLWCECGSWCSEDALCDCCELVELRAEVERLTAEVEALRNSLGHCAAENATLRENDVLWRSRMKTAEAQVQRVRDMCTGYERTVFAAVSAGYVASAPVASVANDLRRALDGGESDE